MGDRESYMKNDFINRSPIVEEAEAEPLTQSQLPALDSLPPPPPPQEVEMPGLVVPPLMAQAVPQTTVYQVQQPEAVPQTTVYQVQQPAQTVVYQQPSLYQQAATPTYTTNITAAPAGT